MPWCGQGLPTADILVLFFCRYSTNEGETWKTFTFSEKPVFVYGLLTEPGEKSTIFTIFGSYKENGHSWLILQINTTDVLGKGTPPGPCQAHKSHPVPGCSI